MQAPNAKTEGREQNLGSGELLTVRPLITTGGRFSEAGSERAAEPTCRCLPQGSDAIQR